MGKPATRRKKWSERHSHDHYPTPQRVVEAALALLPAAPPGAIVLDPGAGTGVWGQTAKRFWPGIHLVGVEIQDLPCPDGYDEWHQADFGLWAKQAPSELVDRVIGNPPYGELVEPFCWGSRKVLKPGGHHLFLLALEFLGGQTRGKNLYTIYPPHRIIVSSRRIDFIGGNGDMRNHMLVWWIKGREGAPVVDWFDYESTHHQLSLFTDVRREV